MRNSFSNNLVLDGWLLIMSSLSLSTSLSILCFFWTFMLPNMASICSVWGRRSTSVLRKKMAIEGVHLGERVEPSCFLPWLQFAWSEEGDRPFFWGRRCLLRACILEKEKAEHRVRGLEKFYYYYYYFNIMLTWKIVGVSKTSVIYIYIDYKIK